MVKWFCKPVALSAGLMVLAALSEAASGAIAYLTVSPKTTTVPPHTATSVYLQWRVRSSRDGQVVIQSRHGRFLSPADGRVLGTTLNPLRKSAGGLPRTVVLPERVRVSEDIVKRAVQLQLQLSGIVYEREFDDGAGRARAAVLLQIAGRGGGGGALVFSVRRVLLSFTGGSAQKQVGVNETLRADAEIWYAGVGQLKGRWMLAPQPATDAEPDYAAIAEESFMVKTGDRRIDLKSPALPTAEPGAFLLKFVIDNPQSDIKFPVVRYIVVQ